MRVQDATDKNDLVWMLAQLHDKNGSFLSDWPKSGISRLKAIRNKWGKIKGEPTNYTVFFYDGAIEALFEKI